MARVLVVEDDAEVRRLIRTILESERHSVVEACDATEALERLGERPDVIFVDVDMPGETGVEFLFRVREDPTRAKTPASFVTAHPDRVSRILASGIATHLLEKPFRKQDILDALATMLARVA